MHTVLHLIDTPGPGGAETILADVAGRLDRSRWTSLVAVPQPGWLCDDARARGLEVVLAPVRHSPLDWRYVRRIAAIIREHRVHLLHTHLLTPSVYGGMAAWTRRVPMISTFHGGVDITSSRFTGAKFRIINRTAAAVTFVSDSLRREFLDATPLDPRLASVVYNGVDFGAFVPRRNDALRRELNLPPDTILVGALGNVRKAKAYDMLLRVAALLRAQRRFRFVIVGATNDPVYHELLALRRELALEDTLVFSGFRPDVAGILNGFDVLVSTSSSEGFSLTTVQALACGVPVIATRSGGPEEILANDVSGLLVDVGAADQMADALARLAREPETRERFARAGRKLASSRFDVATMVEAYAALYERALGSTPEDDAS